MALRLMLILLVALSAGATDYDAELQRIETELAGATGGKRAYLLYLRASLTHDFKDFRAAELAIDEAGLPVAKAHFDYLVHRFDAAAACRCDPALDADVAFQKGRYEEARRAYEALPPTWDNLARLANLRAKLGDRKAAGRLYERAAEELTVKQMRDFAWIELQRGLVELGAGRPAKALEHYDRAGAAWSGWWLIDEHRAEALQLLGRTEEAVALYREVIARAPRPEVISALAAIVKSEELFAEAERGFQEELALYPEAAAGHYAEHRQRMKPEYESLRK